MQKVGPEPTETSGETIARVLGAYEFGSRLRALRLRKKISLADLGKHTGLSASMLSQLENGRLVPTLPTLARISMVFDVGLEYFFEDRGKKRLFSIVRAGDRFRFPDRADNPAPAYHFEVLAFSAQEKALQGYVADFGITPGEPAEHVHEGSELLHLLTGELRIRFQGKDYILKEGDSVYFDSSAPHSYKAVTPARAIVVTTPPRL